MWCPVCANIDTKVVDSRIAGDGYSIRRRRECSRCRYRFSTGEEVELLGLMLVKRDGRREPYMREKLVRGLKRALEKRPYGEEGFKALVGSLERDFQKKKKDELTSREIGETVMEHLRKFDPVAYVRFASVYRSFEDVKTFQDEVGKLLAGEKRSEQKA